MYRCPKRAAIATRNPGKVRPVRRVLELLCGLEKNEFIVVEPPSGLAAQPVGGLQVFRGALTRALHAFSSVAPRGLGIGIEAGLVEFYTGTGFIETQVAVIVGPGHRYSVGTSASFELPQGIVDAMKRGFELGSLIERRRHVGDLGEGIGYIGLATGGVITREELTFQAIIMALVPWYTGEVSSLGVIKQNI